MIKAVFFDMNETLLDLELLKNKFNEYFENEYTLKLWFTSLLHSSLVIASINEYIDFAKLAECTLDNITQESGQNLTKAEKASILNAFKKLAPHDDVIEALKILKENNIKVIAVSNSSLEMMKEQLTNAGILELFNSYYSVDAVNKYKPFIDIYNFVADKEEVDVKSIMMVATHDWDLFGAKKAGLKTGYIKRKNNIFNPYYPKPDIESDSLVKLTNKIVELK